MNLKIKKLHNSAKIPTYGTKDAACFDIYASEDVEWLEELFCFTAIIKTDLSFEIEKGYRMDIYPRSGWGFKYNIQLANGTGKIDADYRGEVKVKLIAFCEKDNLPEIKKHTRIAQAEINKITPVTFLEVDILSDSERGIGGFGSTGE